MAIERLAPWPEAAAPHWVGHAAAGGWVHRLSRSLAPRLPADDAARDARRVQAGWPGLNDDWLVDGTAQWLGGGLVRADGDACRALDLDPGAEVLRGRWLLGRERQAAGIAERILPLPASLGTVAAIALLALPGPHALRSLQRASAIVADRGEPTVAAALGLPGGTPLLRLRQWRYGGDGRTIELRTVHWRADRASVLMELRDR